MVVLMHGKMCEIRSVGSDSADSVLRVYQACEDFLALGPQRKADMAMVLRDLEESRQHGGFFCRIHDGTGKTIGVVDFTPGGFEGQPHVAFFSLLMVVPPMRRRGIGMDVVGRIEEEIGRDPGVTVIRSAVQVNNPDGKRFWLRCGYRIVGEPEEQPDGTTVVHLEKTLGHGV